MEGFLKFFCQPRFVMWPVSAFFNAFLAPFKSLKILKKHLSGYIAWENKVSWDIKREWAGSYVMAGCSCWTDKVLHPDNFLFGRKQNINLVLSGNMILWYKNTRQFISENKTSRLEE